jgi:hypothetical protein
MTKITSIAVVGRFSHARTNEAETRKQIRPVIVQGPTRWTASSPPRLSVHSHSVSPPLTNKGRLRCSQVASGLVGVAGFEPAASSSRTERTSRRNHSSMTFPHVRGCGAAPVAASDRSCRLSAAPILLPESDLAYLVAAAMAIGPTAPWRCPPCKVSTPKGHSPPRGGLDLMPGPS